MSTLARESTTATARDYALDTELPMARVMLMVPMWPQSSLVMSSLDIQLILRVIRLATTLAIMLATRLATMSATRPVTMLGSTLEATSTTLLEGSTTTSLPTLPPSTSTPATRVLDSRLPTPQIE